jgi:hypothetical protein
MKDKRAVIRLLKQRSYPNIVEAADIKYNKGIYLRRYLSLSELKVSAQIGRI